MYRQAKKRSKQQGRVSTAGLPSLPPPKSRFRDTRSKQRFLCRICGTQLSGILLVWPPKRSHFSCSSGAVNGGSNMAFRKMRNTVEDDRPAETQVEGEIREFVHSDVVGIRRQPESDSELVASNVNQVLQRVAGTSVQEIDKLISELQT